MDVGSSLEVANYTTKGKYYVFYNKDHVCTLVDCDYLYGLSVIKLLRSKQLILKRCRRDAYILTY